MSARRHPTTGMGASGSSSPRQHHLRAWDELPADVNIGLSHPWFPARESGTLRKVKQRNEPTWIDHRDRRSKPLGVFLLRNRLAKWQRECGTLICTNLHDSC